jgi:hypothetical protein
MNGRSIHFMAGLKTKAVSIPIEGLIERVSAVVEEEIPFDDGDFA